MYVLIMCHTAFLVSYIAFLGTKYMKSCMHFAFIAYFNLHCSVCFPSLSLFLKNNIST